VSSDHAFGAEYETVIRGQLVLPDRTMGPGDVGVRDGRIAAVAEAGSLTGASLIDAGDALVLPGVVDVHVHTGSEPSEGIEHATAAAAAGGVTSIVDMPFDASGPVVTADDVLRKAEAVSTAALVDVALYGTVPADGDVSRIESMAAAGVAAFKLSTYRTHPQRFPRSSDLTILHAMREIRNAGSLVAVHCENDEIVAGLIAEFSGSERPLTPSSHSTSRPPVAENHAVAGILELAYATGVAAHICHVSTGRGVDLVSRAREDGVDVTLETCPHYLLLDETELERQGGRAKINPPLRSRAEVDALWAALVAGRIDIVSSDHVGWRLTRKADPDIFAVPAGSPTLELMLPLMHSEGVVCRGMSIHRLVEVLCEAPARRFGLWPEKGAIRVGADADLVVFDPRARWRVRDAQLTTSAAWSAYDGRDVCGRVSGVIARGEPLSSASESEGRAGRGRYLKRIGRIADPRGAVVTGLA
jgi:allantoinase